MDMKHIAAASLTFAIAASASPYAMAAVKMDQLDSSQFDYKYEMLQLPTTEDVDANGVGDFTMNNGSTSWLTISTGTDVGYGTFDCSAANNYLGSNADAEAAGGVWRKCGISSTTGFTIETRLYVTAQTGTAGAIALTASPNDSKVNALLSIHTNKLTWGTTQKVLTNMNTKAYHTYRLVRASGEATYSVWVDGNLVAEKLGDGLSSGSILDRMFFGSIGSNWKGKAVVSYLRFTKGGYAPLSGKDLMRESDNFESKYEMDAADEKFSPTATADDWELSGSKGSATIENGILKVSQPKGQTRYYKTVASMDADDSAAASYTFESKLKVGNAWDGTSGKVLQFLLGTKRASFVFYVGTNTVFVSDGSTPRSVHTGDNSDKMHVFRVTYKGEWPNEWNVYRDGELISTTGWNFSRNGSYDYARFGIASSSTHGGDFDIDYIRWTTKGAFAPVPPPSAFVIVVR